MLIWAKLIAGVVSLLQSFAAWQERRTIGKAATDAKTVDDLAAHREHIRAANAARRDAKRVRDDKYKRD